MREINDIAQKVLVVGKNTNRWIPEYLRESATINAIAPLIYI
jgi:hypothetical protein